jgi:hypothetical protein
VQTQLKLNGVVIKRPSDFKISRYDITKANRLADGLMSMELVAKKRKFFCTWQGITAKDLNVILDILWESTDMFFELSYVENNVAKLATVYKGEIPTTLYRSDDGDWVWKDVTIDLIER